MDDVLQAARIGLCQAVKSQAVKSQAHSRITEVPFGAYARQRMKWMCSYWLFGRVNGNTATKNATRHELSASEEITTREGEVITRLERAENKSAKRALSADVSTNALEARRAEMREAISTLATLTRFERRVLRLRYVDGLMLSEASKKLGWSTVKVKRATRAAIRKLREHLASQGALPPDASLPLQGDGG